MADAEYGPNDWDNLRGEAEGLRIQADRTDVPQLASVAYDAAERLDQVADWIDAQPPVPAASPEPGDRRFTAIIEEEHPAWVQLWDERHPWHHGWQRRHTGTGFHSAADAETFAAQVNGAARPSSPVEADQRPVCGAANGEVGTYRCTLPTGHEGDHAQQAVIASWGRAAADRGEPT